MPLETSSLEVPSVVQYYLSHVPRSVQAESWKHLNPNLVKAWSLARPRPAVVPDPQWRWTRRRLVSCGATELGGREVDLDAPLAPVPRLRVNRRSTYSGGLESS